MAFIHNCYPLNPSLVARAFHVCNGNFGMSAFELRILARALVIVPCGEVWRIYTTAGSVGRFRDLTALTMRVDWNSYLGVLPDDPPTHITVRYCEECENYMESRKHILAFRPKSGWSVGETLLEIALLYSVMVCVDVNLCLGEAVVKLREKFTVEHHLHGEVGNVKWATPSGKLSDNRYHLYPVKSHYEALVRENPWLSLNALDTFEETFLELSWKIAAGSSLWYNNQHRPHGRYWRWYRCGVCYDYGELFVNADGEAERKLVLCGCVDKDAPSLPPPVILPVLKDDLWAVMKPPNRPSKVLPVCGSATLRL